ncbi:MAG: transglutaminase N-terminal domain-containing protein, partial [Microbacterium sp.]
MRYRVTHRTDYSYDADVSGSFGFAHLTPRTLPFQRSRDHRVAVEPAPGDLRTHVDGYGNTATYFHVTAPHRRLTIDASTEVEVVPPAYDPGALAEPWE